MAPHLHVLILPRHVLTKPRMKDPKPWSARTAPPSERSDVHAPDTVVHFTPWSTPLTTYAQVRALHLSVCVCACVRACVYVQYVHACMQSRNLGSPSLLCSNFRRAFADVSNNSMLSVCQCELFLYVEFRNFAFFRLQVTPSPSSSASAEVLMPCCLRYPFCSGS